MDLLRFKVASLGNQDAIPTFANTHILHNPIDIYRSHLAELLTPLIDADRQLIYNSIQWSNNLAHGDLFLVIPKLRLKGVKPAEFALAVSQKVSTPILLSYHYGH